MADRNEKTDSLCEHLLQELLGKAYALNDAYRIVSSLEQLSERTRFGGGSHEPMSEEWNPALLQELIESDSSVILSSLKDRLAALPRLVLYVPAVFSKESLMMIGEWCRKNVDEKVMLDIRIDSNAAGGCIFVWNDKLYDFSLAYFLEKRKEEFRSILTASVPSPAI